MYVSLWGRDPSMYRRGISEVDIYGEREHAVIGCVELHHLCPVGFHMHVRSNNYFTIEIKKPRPFGYENIE